MITFREVNDEYLEYDCLKDTSELVSQLKGKDIDKTVLQEFIKQDIALFDYSKKIRKSITKLVIRKDSIIGEYLLSCKDEDRVLNSSKYIDYDKVVNAFNVSIFSSNLEISKSIYPLFMNKVEGTYQNLSNKYDLATIDYILANSSFKSYLENNKNTLNDGIHRVVYENDRCFLKELKPKNKTLVKSNKNF